MQRHFAGAAWLLKLLAGLLIASQSLAAGAIRGGNDVLDLRSPPVLRNYGEAEGLPQISANTLLRTHDGFLWVGTFGGLARFDGHEFRTFRSADGLPSRRIVSLYEDGRHRLWIGTEDAGVSLYEHGRFRQLPVCGGHCLVRRVLSTDGHDLWVLTDAEAVRVDPDSLQAIQTRAPANGRDASVRPGKLVILGSQPTLKRLSGAGLESVPLPDGCKLAYGLVDDGPQAWVFVEGGRLYRYDVASGRWTLLRDKLPVSARILSDGAGGIYLSADNMGTHRLARDGSDMPLDGAERLYATSLLSDGDGTLWIGTPGKGLWSLRSSRVDLARSRAAPDASGSLVMPDGAGGMWLVMGCLSLSHRTADGRQTTVSLDGKIGEGCIHSLLKDDAGDALWIGVTGGVLARLAGGNIEHVVAWPQQGQIGVWKTQGGLYWVANRYSVGRLRLKPNGAFDALEQIPELAGMMVKQIVDARAGGVWVVGDRGAFRVRDNAVVERWTQDQGIRGRYFRALYEDADGVLWIGSYGNGLIRIEHGAIRQYTEANGLFDDTVSCILPSTDGRLWLAGNRGISLLDRRIGADGLHVLTLKSSDGLDPSELNGSNSPCADDGTGNLWFSMMIGFARVTPARLRDWASNRVPPAYIDHAAVSQQELDVFRPAELGINAANLEIRYGAIDFLDPDKVRYRYRVTGAAGGENNWVDAGSSRSVLLPELPWGHLTFEVQARELGGAWSPSATLQLNHPQPWYKYHWIWLAASLASLLALLWMTRERQTPDVDDDLLARLRRADAKGDRSGR